MDLYLYFVMMLQLFVPGIICERKRQKKHSVYKWVTLRFRKQHKDRTSDVFFLYWSGSRDTAAWTIGSLKWLLLLFFLTLFLSQLGHFRTSGVPLTSGGPQGAAFGPISFLLNRLVFALNELEWNVFNTNKLCAKATYSDSKCSLFCKKESTFLHPCDADCLYVCMSVLVAASWKNLITGNVFFHLNSLTDCSCNGAITSL